MAFSRGNMKVLSCFQVVLALLFFIFGLVERFEVKLVYSFVAIPCWTSFFLLLSGVVGLVAAIRARPPSSTMLNMTWSLSVGSVMLTALIIFLYVTQISVIVFANQRISPFTGEVGPPKYSKEERKQLGIMSFILILALAEMITGLGIAANCRGEDGSYMRFQQPMPAVALAAPQASQNPTAMMQQQPVVAIPVGPTYK